MIHAKLFLIIQSCQLHLFDAMAVSILEICYSNTSQMWESVEVAKLRVYSFFPFVIFCELFSISDLLFCVASICTTNFNVCQCHSILWLRLYESCEWNDLCFFFDDVWDWTPILQLISEGDDTFTTTGIQSEPWTVSCMLLHWQSLNWCCNQITFLQHVLEIKQICLAVSYKTMSKINCTIQSILNWSKISIISPNFSATRPFTIILTTSLPICDNMVQLQYHWIYFLLTFLWGSMNKIRDHVMWENFLCLKIRMQIRKYFRCGDKLGIIPIGARNSQTASLSWKCCFVSCWPKHQQEMLVNFKPTLQKMCQLCLEKDTKIDLYQHNVCGYCVDTRL